MNERPEDNPPCDDGGSAGMGRDALSGEEPQPDRPREIGGRNGPEPTRFGDWEKNGRCIDF
jgi:hypothetical protein